MVAHRVSFSFRGTAFAAAFLLLSASPLTSAFFVCDCVWSAQFHQYQVVGRALPTPGDEQPKIYRMKLWATNEVRSKSKFWSVHCTLETMA